MSIFAEFKFNFKNHPKSYRWTSLTCGKPLRYSKSFVSANIARTADRSPSSPCLHVVVFAKDLPAQFLETKVKWVDDARIGGSSMAALTHIIPYLSKHTGTLS